ncbi:hypothetical protein HC62_16715 [Acetobacter tropicalis]|uniref:Uncharacterized protein n=1 Tax=Acetobacter tropicalis TaxID=104102 RepID=A0A252A162_9PROT|nr:hypothetical protein HC62_16715 [Acetobacter tropicalis]
MFVDKTLMPGEVLRAVRSAKFFEIGRRCADREGICGQKATDDRKIGIWLANTNDSFMAIQRRMNQMIRQGYL